MSEVKINLIWAMTIVLVIGGLIFSIAYIQATETDYKKCLDKCSNQGFVDDRQMCYERCDSNHLPSKKIENKCYLERFRIVEKWDVENNLIYDSVYDEDVKEVPCSMMQDAFSLGDEK
jgi:hypothetical protein